MKTKILLVGVVVAAISACTLSAKAQTQPAVKIIPGLQSNTIKLIYGYDRNETVEISFLDKTGVIRSEHIKAKNFNHGFVKKYKIQRDQYDAFWVEVKNSDMIVTYKLVAPKDGQWLAQLEKATYNYPTVASR
ncbi:MAG: hypothetical protein ACKOC0_03985 [Cytophagales bacterium]